MAPTNYERGRAFEYKRKEYYEGLGYIVTRSAGSHGSWDLTAVPKHGLVLLIQCKIVDTRADYERMKKAVIAWFEDSGCVTEVLDVYIRNERKVQTYYL